MFPIKNYFVVENLLTHDQTTLECDPSEIPSPCVFYLFMCQFCYFRYSSGKKVMYTKPAEKMVSIFQQFTRLTSDHLIQLSLFTLSSCEITKEPLYTIVKIRYTTDTVKINVQSN